MVFNPTSPIRVFGRRPVIVPQSATQPSAAATAENASKMSSADAPQSSYSLTGWRGEVSRLMRQSQERHPHRQEISRWSKTSTESEAPEALQAPSSKKATVLKKRSKQRRLSKDTTNSSPVDPSYDPVTKTLRPVETFEMPPIAITGPDEPRSFYESGSDDSGDNEHIIHRASSVRVARPHIVQHSNASGGSVPKLYAPPTSTASQGQASEVSPARGPNLKKLQDMAASAERRLNKAVSGGPAEALKALEGRDTDHEGMTASTEASTAPGSQQDNTMKETILEFPDTPSKLEALDTLPTPMGGFGSLRMHSTNTNTNTNTDTMSSSSTYVTPGSIDGLRSNPTTETDRKLSRAISAPVRNSTRRVTIRPAALVINRTDNDPKLFRESVVSTPYPARHSSIGEIDELQSQEMRTPRSLRRTRPLSNHKESEFEGEKYTDELGGGEKSQSQDHAPEVPLSTKPLPSAPATSRSDRFPSPVAPEVLLLDLRLARHPSARITVEIEVADKTTFDDEALFMVIREVYRRRLLGVVRRFFSSRTLSYASVANNSTSTIAPILTNPTASGLRALGSLHGQPWTLSEGAPEIDGGDFIKHLLSPRHGRRRKMWLLWLRNSQYSCDSSASASTIASQARRSRVASPSSSSHSPQAPDSPVFSFLHSRHSSSSAGGGGGGGGNHTHSINNDFLLSSPTMTPNHAVSGLGLSIRPSISIPRMPFQPFPFQSKSTATRRHRAGGEHVQSGPPTLYLHHRFSLRKLVAVLALTFFLAVFTTTMWILFGVPGRGADQGNGTTEVQGKAYTLSWRRDAQSRVGVGLVLGIVVLVMGLVSEAVWLWVSWILV
ncbi:hypothetical protein A1O3_06601 [Capronia epimyces CBS 606.96]|uniref:Uncharacterized protein n=1 Tax=Capronia epimyces CBS 606.96 TaxID=1182542 RepID=W9Y0L9_9EURO|nr:uncharacterized protein A1O3_06601 [Capronia epimyces CBS 606.96]EXJ82786.1 hypothetical protein A1O3_06601 [Capronia epimyces CBS 606.96]